MGFAPTHPEKNQETTPKSHFQPMICLTDWWLVNAENDVQGSRLAVAGFSYVEKQAMRVFSSSPILKRYDAFTLENSDGICVTLDGFINKTRTVENGFPSDIFDHFVFGFPPYWKEYDEKFLQKPETEQHDDEKNTTTVPKRRGRSRLTPAVADNQKHKAYDLSDNKTSGVKTSGKLTAEKEQNDDEKNTTTVHKKKGKPCSAPAAVNNKKRKACADEDYLYDNKTSGAKTRRKLAYETPVRERENNSVALNQVPSGASTGVPVTRSRSGRLLMPPLEFWRNQRAIYDVDRTVTGILEATPSTTRKRKWMEACKKEVDASHQP